MMLQPPRANNAATYTQTQQRMGPRHEGFVETAKKGDIDLLFHGDSITDWWVQGDANKAMFDKYFGAMKTANFAVAGDTTQGVLWGLKNGEGQGFQPKAVMLMIGTNNTGGPTRARNRRGCRRRRAGNAQGFSRREDSAARDLPAQPPGDPVRDKIADINKIISKLDDQQHVFYMDIGSEVPRREGRVPAGFVPRRQPAPAGQGLRHLGNRGEGQARRVDEVVLVRITRQRRGARAWLGQLGFAIEPKHQQRLLAAAERDRAVLAGTRRATGAAHQRDVLLPVDRRT